ncbi:S26 family signal peptidase [Sphingomonas sp. Ant H11]|uniref:S26 family signal peptidase n=1 Tax=Sphingomonas sp. Ant H11 TaxID=1564113 RepID=UPI000A5E80A4
MSRLGYVIVTALLAELFAGLFVAVALLAPHPRLLWNATASAPIGLYRLTAVDRPGLGDMVAVMPPPNLARFMAERRYLPLGVPLLKHLAADPGARICRHGARVTVDDRMVAIARTNDSHGRPLPVWRGCHVLGPRELFLLNTRPTAWTGAISDRCPSTVCSAARPPMLTRDAPDAPLRWRGLTAPTGSPTPSKDVSYADRQLSIRW